MVGMVKGQLGLWCAHCGSWAFFYNIVEKEFDKAKIQKMVNEGLKL